MISRVEITPLKNTIQHRFFVTDLVRTTDIIVNEERLEDAMASMLQKLDKLPIRRFGTTDIMQATLQEVAVRESAQRKIAAGRRWKYATSTNGLLPPRKRHIK